MITWAWSSLLLLCDQVTHISSVYSCIEDANVILVIWKSWCMFIKIPVKLEWRFPQHHLVAKCGIRRKSLSGCESARRKFTEQFNLSVSKNIITLASVLVLLKSLEFLRQFFLLGGRWDPPCRHDFIHPTSLCLSASGEQIFFFGGLF